MNHIVYKTTNIKNSKIYLGVHSQESDPSEFDGYLGSGSALMRAVNKYGKLNFIRETLFSYSDKELAFQKESELVTEDFISERTNYNLVIGGKGNIDHHTKNPEVIAKAKNSRKLNGTDQMKQCHTPEAKIKAQTSRNLSGNSLMKHCKTDEALRAHLESRLANNLQKFPELNIPCKVWNIDNELEFEGTTYEVAVYIYSVSYAIEYRDKIIAKRNNNKRFHCGKWKGYHLSI